jgi:hypothetical protein
MILIMMESLIDMEDHDMEDYLDTGMVSDLHKSAYYHRPDSSWWDWWSSLSDVGKKEVWRQMDDMATESFSAECQSMLMHCKVFEGHINQLLEAGAPDRVTAIKWFVQELELDEWDKGDGGYLCYLLNLCYDGYSDEFNQALKDS